MAIRSDYANQLHQLLISVAGRLYVKRDGFLRYQEKKLDVSLNKLSRSSRTHVLIYLVRDHFSGALYGEMCPSDAPISMDNFLHRAWAEKAYYDFCGLPDNVIVPRAVSEHFPGLDETLQRLGVNIVRARSGFDTGVRVLKTWQSEIRFFDGLSANRALKELTPYVNVELNGATEIRRKLATQGAIDTPKIDIWLQNIGAVRLPPDWLQGEQSDEYAPEEIDRSQRDVLLHRQVDLLRREFPNPTRRMIRKTHVREIDYGWEAYPLDFEIAEVKLEDDETFYRKRRVFRVVLFEEDVGDAYDFTVDRCAFLQPCEPEELVTIVPAGGVDSGDKPEIPLDWHPDFPLIVDWILEHPSVERWNREAHWDDVYWQYRLEQGDAQEDFPWWQRRHNSA